LSLTKARVDVLIWVMLYAGLVLLGLGLAVRRVDDGLGWGIALAGIAIGLLGAALVWVRSRMKEER
jgi:hypothetical protein